MNMDEILQDYRDGKITIAECWERLKVIRQPKPHNEPELTTPPSRVYEPLNEMELGAIKHLQGVHFGASNGMKRFARQSKDAKELTARQREYLRLLIWRFRRQVFRTRNPDASARTYISKMKGG
jgi:hypothetical protein